ncbi:MAG: DUF3352 domain-containing protein [Chloroflexota bacterium]
MKRTYIAIPVVASILIVGAVVVALWFIGSASGERSKFSSLEIAPQNTDVFFAINTDPTSSQWLAVNGSLEQINAKDSLRKAIDDALADVNLQWDRDIVPVAGDEAFFSIPDITKVGDEKSGWVGGVLLADAAHAKEVFDTLRNQPDAKPLKTEDYNGVTIYYSDPNATSTDPNPTCPPGNGSDFCLTVIGETSVGDNTALAFVDNVMALGSSPDAAKSVIDVVQGKAPSAEKNDRLQEFRAQQKQDFLVWGYADLADVWTQAEDSLPTESVDGTVDTKKAFETIRKTYDRVGFSVSSNSSGFALDLSVLHSSDFNPDDAFEPSTAYEPKIAEMLPADTMFYMSAFDLYNQSWLPAKKVLEDQTFEDGHKLDYYLQQFKDETGLDLESDVLSLFTGEFAVAGNVSNFDADTPDVTVYGIADVSDAGKAKSSGETLTDYLESQGTIEVTATGDVHRISSPDDSTEAFAWTVRDTRLVLAFPDDKLNDITDASQSLAQTEEWKQTMSLLPDDKTWVGFLSIERIIDEVRKVDGAEKDFADSTDGKVTLADLDAIRSVGMAGTANEKGFGLHFVLFMKDR